MNRIERVIFCSCTNFESIFDLDYSNQYQLVEPSNFFKVYSESKGSPAPTFIENGVLYCYSKNNDTLLIFVIRDGENIKASSKVALLQFLHCVLKVVKDFVGVLSTTNLLANVTLIAEIIDCMLVGGLVHLTETNKIRGFLSQNYNEPHSKPQPSYIATSLLVSPTKQLPQSGHHPSTKDKVVPVSQPQKPIEDVYIDMIEVVNADIISSGEMLCSVTGLLKSNNTTTSQRNVTFQLNQAYNKIIGCSWSPPCIDTQQFNTSGSFTASLPLGGADLLSYNITLDYLPFELAVRHESGNLKMMLSCQVPAGVMCLNTKITYSFPFSIKGILKQSHLPSHKLTYNSDQKQIEWDVPEVAGQTTCESVFKILPVDREPVHIPNQIFASLDFEICNYLHSGVRLSSVRFDHPSGLKKWIRHVSSSGKYFLTVEVAS